jgi:hypothetical protein
LFIDNCSAKPTNISASNVRIIFLPSNTTSVLQPTDAGIIKCFKGYSRVKMRRYLIRWLSENQYGDSVKSNALKFYQACQMAIASLAKLESSTISNCFRHYGFFKAKCSL